MSDVYTTIKLSTGDSCEILEVKPVMMWKSHFKAALMKDEEVNNIPFLIEQCITINGKKVDWRFIGNMEYQDYMKIEEVVCKQITPLF